MATRTLKTSFLAIFVALASAALITPAYAGSPFPSLAGTWSGSGKVKLLNGKTERLRCKAYYTKKSADALGMSIRCASPSNKFTLRAKLQYSGGAISGSWTETNFNATGGLSGKASSSKLSLSIQGGISGFMSVSVNGRSQNVSLSTKGETAFRGVNINFRKRG